MKKKKNSDGEIIWVFVGMGILGYAITRNKAISITIFLVSVILYFLYIYLKGNIKRNKYLKSGINIIDKMEGDIFEEFLLAHFQKLGYKGETTAKTNDYGADLILKKDGEIIVVQAKRYSNRVGISAIQEILGAKEYYKANKCMVVTNNFFTHNAINLANSSSVELWDRNRLIEIMSKQNGRESIESMKTINGNKICKTCGSDMIFRKGKYGYFYGCSNYPKCKYTEKTIEENGK